MIPIDHYDTIITPNGTYYPSYSAYHGVQDGTEYPRYPRRDFLTIPAPVSKPPCLTAPATEPSTSRSTTPIILPSDPGSMPYPLPYPLPYPAPYPLPPQTVQENRASSSSHHMLSQVPQYLFAPPGLFPARPTPHPYQTHQPLPAGARALSPPRPITADDLRHKCGVCGRFRSPRYHYQHPIPPGELPKKTICRRCRDASTDSDESYDSTGRTTRYSRTRSKSRSRFGDEAGDHAMSDRDRWHSTRRAPARVRIVEGSMSRGRRLSTRSYYRSDSLDNELDRLEIIDQRRWPRPRSPSFEVVERIRYIEDAPRRPATRETVYIEERAPAMRVSRHSEEHSDGDDDDDDDGDDDALDRLQRRSITCRSTTPTHQIIRCRSADPGMRAPRRSEDREYFDRPNSVVEETTEVIQLLYPPPRPPSRPLIIRRHMSESDECDQNTQEGQRRHYRNGSRARSRSRSSGRVHHRRRSRYSGKGDEELLDAPPQRYMRAPLPSPPSPFRSSSLGYLHPRPDRKQPDGTRTRKPEAFDHHSRSATLTRIGRSRSRPRSRSRSRSRSREARGPGRSLTFQRPRNEVIAIEHHGRMPTEDYDWYDRDGMRVRVREI